VKKQIAGRAGFIARLTAMIPEREIFVRAGGTVRFVLITTRMQLVAAGLLLALLSAWGLGTGVMLWRQSSIAAAQAALAAQRSAVSTEAARASADRRSVDSFARELEQRQDALDALMGSHFGGGVDQSRVVGKEAPETGKPKTIGSAQPSAAQPRTAAERLAMLRERQDMFARDLASAAKARLAQVEAAIRGVGLSPAQLTRGGQGGPFIPAAENAMLSNDARLRSLSRLLDRLSTLEAALSVLPSGRPTMTPMQTSSYGYRRDPFNGLMAFHAGIDFPGAYRQPILAASDGKIIFAGPKAGYGNCIEVDHGHAIVTRYAHLSGFDARVGQTVRRGQQIGRMGSTGRSTGTHLHFEVRVNGAAINPRPFLEARNDVLETRQTVLRPAQNSGQRASNRG
jgi:murein DD-endopeptidase MepM/ murein hydrolase activator NlpD